MRGRENKWNRIGVSYVQAHMTPLPTTPMTTPTAGSAGTDGIPTVTVAEPTLTALSLAETDVAATVSTVAATESSSLAALSATFGVIGADFLAATEIALAARRNRLTQIANNHWAVAGGTVRAGSAYAGADTGAATTIDSAEQELTL